MRKEDLVRKLTDMSYLELLEKVKSIRKARSIAAASANEPKPSRRKTKAKRLIDKMSAEQKAELIKILESMED